MTIAVGDKLPDLALTDSGPEDRPSVFEIRVALSDLPTRVGDGG